MERFNFIHKKRNTLIPFLDEKAVNKRFFVNRCKVDPEFLEHLQKHKFEFIEKTIESSPHSFMKLPLFRRNAQIAIWRGFDDGFCIAGDRTKLHNLYPPYSQINEKSLFRSMGTIGYCSIFASIAILGLISGLIITASTGMLTLLQGGLIGLGGGLMLGAITGHAVYNKIFNSYEQLFIAGAKEGSQVVHNEISNTVKNLENVMTHTYGKQNALPYKYPAHPYSGSAFFGNHVNTRFSPLATPYSYISSPITYCVNDDMKKKQEQDNDIGWRTKVLDELEDGMNNPAVR